MRAKNPCVYRVVVAVNGVWNVEVWCGNIGWVGRPVRSPGNYPDRVVGKCDAGEVALIDK